METAAISSVDGLVMHSGDDFAKVLDRVGVKPPQPGDKLPFDKH